MATTPEGKLWELLRDNTKPYGIHWQRIESATTGRGIPDVNGCWNGAEAWIELKIIRGHRVKFQTEQPVWLYKRSMAGGKCWVLARRTTKDGDELWLWPGIRAMELKKKKIQEVPPTLIYKQRNQWSWSELITNIFWTNQPPL